MSNYIFMSYARHDELRATEVIEELQRANVGVWRDRQEIIGGENYGTAIVKGIRNSKALLLMCSAAAFRSANVKQEILLAWHYRIPYIPLLLDDSIISSYPEQVQYWLEGSQWIQVLRSPPEKWLSSVLRALAQIGVASNADSVPKDQESATEAPQAGFAELKRIARMTDQLWPVHADADKSVRRCAYRDLGAPQPDVNHTFRLGDRVRILLEAEHGGNLLLLNEGTSGKIYSLSPSAFAPNTRIDPGQHLFPQPQSTYDAFVVSGTTGREHILAILTEQRLDHFGDSYSREQPAQVLSQEDLDRLLRWLHALDPGTWLAMGTYFDVRL